MSAVIPDDLLPLDGRFGSGPAKVRPEAVAALAQSPLLGTSHRQPAVKNLVAKVQDLAADLFNAPNGYELVLGNGGATMFWDVATCSLVEQRSAHGVFGEFSKKFATATARAPFLAEPVVIESEPGTSVVPTAVEGVDLYAWAQNETSTGAAAPVDRPEGIGDALVLVDATSSAGGMHVDLAETDVYYFAPQKNFSSDGGLWLAWCSPAALERAARLTERTDRWVPESLNLTVAATNSRANQTLNTPAIATLVLLADQLAWLVDNGGLDFAAGRTKASTDLVYEWADNHALARPFVAPEFRSPVVATIDFDDTVDAKKLAADLRANGIVDTEPYRKLGRNQLRIGCFASVDPDDVRRLLTCIDWLLEHR
ncbi:phosphoserine transaminase [Propionibacteriaceae bacterium G57]|uniref:phosphoserine transaminase n=1 Tax=Aestuariimicrobium sp. G57 TaxID=3418485 RepID=UPI003DA793C3